MNARLNAAQALSGGIGAGSVVVNDYQIQADAIDGGHRLTITRGSEVQTMDLMDGAPGAPGEPGPAGPQGKPGQDAPQESVLFTAQSLTGEQQAQARENIGAADAETVNELKGEIANLDSVLYTAQSLTGEQQTQARENIAAAGVERVEAVETALGGKLDGTPGTWPVWTADEQAAARERIGEFTDSPLETVADATLDEDVTFFKIQLAKPCRFITCTFIIPPESNGQNRNIYFAANIDTASVFNMFTRSAPVSTSSTDSAFYLASALIVGGKILSFGCISSVGTSIKDHQTGALNNPPNGFCVLDAQNFETIAVYTWGTAFPAGSQLVVTGC